MFQEGIFQGFKAKPEAVRALRVSVKLIPCLPFHIWLKLDPRVRRQRKQTTAKKRQLVWCYKRVARP